REMPHCGVGKVLHASGGRMGGFRPRGPPMDASKIESFVAEKWDDDIVPQLIEYIRIPNKSPMFDADWVKNGYMEDAVRLMEAWAVAQSIPGMRLEVVRLEGRTPLIFIDIPASGAAADASASATGTPGD